MASVENGNRISRRSISKNPPAGTEQSTKDPFQTLKSILGSNEYELEVDQDKGWEQLDQLNEYDGTSLEEIRFLSTTNNLETDHSEELDRILQFKSTVELFNKIITPLSDYLIDFNKKLMELSKELESLKSKSVNLSKNLSTRQILENKYTPIVSDLIIPPDVIRSIYNGEINQSWCENLQFLQEKTEIYNKYKEQCPNLKSLESLTKTLDLLYIKAIERIKNFMVSQIKSLRTIGTPSQVIQDQLIRCRDIYPFLQNRQPSLALEIRQAYVYTMKWYYHTHFQRYLQSLHRLTPVIVDKDSLIGGTQSLFKKSSIIDYSLGKRADIIKAEDPTVMPAQIAEFNQLKFHMETGFRSFNLAIIDNGSVEYLFLMEFFQMSGDVNGIFEQIFSTTFQLGVNYTKELVTSTYDIFGVLILIRLTQGLIFELQRRRIPVIEDYLNLQLITLWPKFQNLVDLNCENMKRSSSKSSSITGIKSNVSHPLTLQFTNLLTGFLKLTPPEQQSTQEPLYQSVQRIRNDYESTLTKMSKNLKQNELFLYNNYSYVWGILSECEGSLATSETEHFKLLVEAYKPK
ncbi:Vacuolar protein sorting-associated protein [Wickerhamomyces ciferrii]|uniref:Vacuolar protein sorting-associated protein n=1 Tax=Wickerhamomyces ciferrii (strain ATCC 14091 / BCRC 22168 / CBS 111 / JCM 3599 / NBRC 0793 / NRRL Y-1031 F-60-10) TaxID=1206466 RepID=K0KMZ5_WICCF|nr:Vacuolar protein sorting-associated protein [Wickerhamomyces ciferrii]CCH42729.1 Vacuolar protein sorting-associated protein [Wickerhamomyces ciferrii]